MPFKFLATLVVRRWGRQAVPGPVRGAHRGASLIELLIAIAGLLLVFASVVLLVNFASEVLANNKARAGALALANERMEYLRSLSYDAIGTQGGIPAGSVAQREVVVLNGIAYTRRTLVLYVDDPADGLGSADSTGITADYKRARVEVSWQVRGASSSVALVSNFSPKGIESLSGGGTLRLTAIDALGQAIAGASVRVVNNATNPAIDATYYTDTGGEVIVPGAPAASEYEIYVSKSGYSTAQTYSASSTNPNPSPAHLTVVEGNTTQATFAIDRVAQKTIVTRAPVTQGTFTDGFDDESQLASLASTVVATGTLMLMASTSGEFVPAGTGTSVTIAPSGLVQWKQLSWNAAVPASTTLRVGVLYDSGGSVFVRVPDTVLPGNSLGFSASPVDLTTLSPTTYPALRLEAVLATQDTATSAVLTDWTLTYDAGFTPIGNVTFHMRGAKIIGDNGGVPVYKFTATGTTDSAGTYTFSNLEWDTYTLSVPESSGYDVTEYCPPQPRGIAPDSMVTTAISLAPNTPHSLRVVVRDSSNAVLEGASVRVMRPGYDVTRTTTSCGQAYFGGLAEESDYTIVVSHPSFPPQTLAEQAVAGDTVIEVTLAP